MNNIEKVKTENSLPDETDDKIIASASAAAAATEMAKTDVAKKKSKAPLIIVLVILGILLLGGAGFAIWYFAYYNNTDKVVSDAMHNLFNSSALTTETKAELSFSDPDTTGLDSISVKANSGVEDGKIKDVEADISLATPDDDDQTFGLSAKIKDKSLYLNLRGLDEPLSNLFGGYNVLQVLDYFDQYIKGNQNVTIEDVETTEESLDDVWWELNGDDIIEALDLGTSQEKSAKAAYTCVTDLMDASSQNSAKLGEHYEKHPFLIATPYSGMQYHSNGGALYSAKLDEKELKSFIKSVAKDNSLNDFTDCLEDSGLEFSNISSDVNIDDKQIDELVKHFPESVVMEIDSWSHQMKALYLELDEDDYSGNITMTFDYPASLPTVSTPKEYRPVSDVVKSIVYIYTSLATRSE